MPTRNCKKNIKSHNCEIKSRNYLFNSVAEISFHTKWNGVIIVNQMGFLKLEIDNVVPRDISVNLSSYLSIKIDLQSG